MSKLIVCRIATLVSGLLAVIVYMLPDASPNHPNHWDGAALGLISAIFGTQWIEYQKRRHAASTQPGRRSWLCRLLFSGLLELTVLTTNAQTTWTNSSTKATSGGFQRTD